MSRSRTLHMALAGLGLTILTFILLRSQGRTYTQRAPSPGIGMDYQKGIWFAYLDPGVRGVEVWRIMPDKSQYLKVCDLEGIHNRNPDYVLAPIGPTSTSFFVRGPDGWYNVNTTNGQRSNLTLPSSVSWTDITCVASAPAGSSWAFLAKGILTIFDRRARTKMYELAHISAISTYSGNDLLVVDSANHIIDLRVDAKVVKVVSVTPTNIVGKILQAHEHGDSLALRTNDNIYILRHVGLGEYKLAETLPNQHPVEIAWLDDDRLAFRCIIAGKRIGAQTEVRLHSISQRRTTVWYSPAWGMLGYPIPSTRNNSR